MCWTCPWGFIPSPMGSVDAPCAYAFLLSPTLISSSKFCRQTRCRWLKNILYLPPGESEITESREYVMVPFNRSDDMFIYFFHEELAVMDTFDWNGKFGFWSFWIKRNEAATLVHLRSWPNSTRVECLDSHPPAPPAPLAPPSGPWPNSGANEDTVKNQKEKGLKAS
jgi:hypothetical protein